MPKKKKKKRLSSISPVAKRHILHSEERASERFGLQLTPLEILEIGRLIRQGKSIYIGTQSKTRTHHLVNYMGKEMRVVYDKKNKVPVTLMSLKENQKNES